MTLTPGPLVRMTRVAVSAGFSFLGPRFRPFGQPTLRFEGPTGLGLKSRSGSSESSFHFEIGASEMSGSILRDSPKIYRTVTEEMYDPVSAHIIPTHTTNNNLHRHCSGLTSLCCIALDIEVMLGLTLLYNSLTETNFSF